MFNKYFFRGVLRKKKLQLMASVRRFFSQSDCIIFGNFRSKLDVDVNDSCS